MTFLSPSPSLWLFLDAWDRPAVAKALYAFAGEMPCDLQFETGEW